MADSRGDTVNCVANSLILQDILRGYLGFDGMVVSPISSLSAIGSPEKRLEKIRIYVSCNYSRNIGIDEIASYAGMNRTSFCSFFKRHVGKTFTHALNDYRIERACELLARGDASVSDVAALCGFKDSAYFIKTFKKTLGTTPAKWKNKH